MQSMIASQQQLIRRQQNNSNSTANTNTSVNNNNGNATINKDNVSNDNSLNGMSMNERELTITAISTACTTPATTTTTTTTTTSSTATTSSTISTITTSSASTTSTSVENLSCDSKKCDKNRVKKRRSNSSWLNLLSPSYKTRHEEFKRLFCASVPNNERLVVDYSCALQKEILVHGRIYVSLNYLAFYANIFKWETSVVIKCRDIKSLTKANTARVIPNAIQVITNNGDKYIFTSFAARDKTYVMIFRIWQNALLDEPVSNAQVWQWVHYSYGDDLGLTSDDDADYANCTNDTNATQALNENSDSCNSSDHECQISSIDNACVDVYEDAIDEQTNYSQCKCAKHDGKLILNITFPVNIDRIFELIFTDSKFIHNVHKSRRTYDLTITQWEDNANDKVRLLNYTVALNHALVKSAQTIETQKLLQESIPGSVYMIYSEADNEGIPYCDTFSTHSQWCLTQDADHVTRLKVHAEVFYKKNLWGLGLMKPMIEKNSIQGITDFCNDLSNQLPRWVQMEESLSIVNQLPLNAKNNNFIESVSTISDSLIQNNLDVSDRLLNTSSDSTKFNTNINSKYFLSSRVSDSFLLRLILIILFLLFILNIIVFIRVWQIESRTQQFNSFLYASTNLSDNSQKWKQFIDSALKLVKLIETNLYELKHESKDEL